MEVDEVVKILTDNKKTIEIQEKQTWEDLKSTVKHENITEIEVLLDTLKILKTRKTVYDNLIHEILFED